MLMLCSNCYSSATAQSIRLSHFVQKKLSGKRTVATEKIKVKSWNWKRFAGKTESKLNWDNYWPMSTTFFIHISPEKIHFLSSTFYTGKRIQTQDFEASAQLTMNATWPVEKKREWKKRQIETESKIGYWTGMRERGRGWMIKKHDWGREARRKKERNREIFGIFGIFGRTWKSDRSK